MGLQSHDLAREHFVGRYRFRDVYNDFFDIARDPGEPCMKKINSSKWNSAAGITVTEVIVAAVLMMTIMGLVGTVCHRVNLIWFDVNHHRVAVSELSNQLEDINDTRSGCDGG